MSLFSKMGYKLGWRGQKSRKISDVIYFPYRKKNIYIPQINVQKFYKFQKEKNK